MPNFFANHVSSLHYDWSRLGSTNDNRSIASIKSYGSYKGQAIEYSMQSVKPRVQIDRSKACLKGWVAHVRFKTIVATTTLKRHPCLK